MTGLGEADARHIYESLGEIKGTLAAIAAGQHAQDARLSDHGSRLSKLEHRQSWLWGVGAAVTTMATAAIATASGAFERVFGGH